VEVRADGATEYTRVVDRLDNTQAGTIVHPITDTFPGIPARYVRLTVVSGDSITYSGPWASISEFRVFGEPYIFTSEKKITGGGNSFSLVAYPNPFHQQAHIRFSLPHPGRVTINIFSITGKKIITLTNALFPAGEHIVTLNAEKDLRSAKGSFLIYRFSYNNHINTGKIFYFK
jgi:hypothetical protein